MESCYEQFPFGKCIGILINKHENSDIKFFVFEIYIMWKIIQVLIFPYKQLPYSYRTANINIVIHPWIKNRVLIYPLKSAPCPQILIQNWQQKNCHFFLHLILMFLGIIKPFLQTENVHNILNYISVNWVVAIIFPPTVSSPDYELSWLF